MDGVTKDLARWWNTLNEWEWPEDMPMKPDGFDDMQWYMPMSARQTLKNVIGFPQTKTRDKYINLAMNRIEGLIGKKECIRYLQVHSLKCSTDSQFESWWELHGAEYD